jgi:ELWxxDGT repeat protein
VKDITQDDETLDYSDVGLMALLGDKLYFSARWANSDGAQSDLYITDGTNAGTEVIGTRLGITTFMPLNDKMLFIHRELYYDDVTQLWVADGTPGGTTKLADMDQGSYYAYHTYLGNFVYFTNGSNDLWRSDGTICATAEFDLGVTNVNPISVVGTTLVFGASSKFYGQELYSFQAGGLPEDPCGASLAAARTSTPDMIYSGEEKVITSTPNPFKNSFSIQVNNVQGLPAQVEVYSVTGLSVDRMEIPTNESYIMGERWNTGMYILKVRVGNQISIDKVLKE